MIAINEFVKFENEKNAVKTYSWWTRAPSWSLTVAKNDDECGGAGAPLGNDVIPPTMLPLDERTSWINWMEESVSLFCCSYSTQCIIKAFWIGKMCRNLNTKKHIERKMKNVTIRINFLWKICE